MRIMKVFYWLTDLKLNESKSELYYAGLTSHQIEQLKEITEFRLGSFPVRYLGVPLSSKKITIKDCDLLVSKITDRITSWTSKFLSYVGRVQLIKSVLSSMQTFWCLHFLLPQRVIQKVTFICAAFLWKGEITSHYGAKVVWTDVCKTKSSGGLGLRDMKLWNKACVFKNLWLLYVRSGSLWVAWCQLYLMEGEDIWTIGVKGSSSWNWRKLMHMRSEARSIFESMGGKFNVSKAWSFLKGPCEQVPWDRTIWFSMHIPKYSFIAWLAILNKLPTLDRTSQWGHGGSTLCLLCGTGLETRDHMFFSCAFSSTIWAKVIRKMGWNHGIENWKTALAWLQRHGKGKSLKSIALRLGWCATIYHIWLERNQRQHGKDASTSGQVFEKIFVAVRDRFLSKLERSTVEANLNVYGAWGIKVTDA